MAVRQYVGARYVPQIMGDWNDQTVYEPLSVVTYNFGSYTSKKAVPAGVEPTNEEYWALTGQYNQQVEEYRQTVEEYKQSVEELKDNIKIIKNDWAKETVVFITDSYGSLPGNFVNKVQTYLNIPNNQFYSWSRGGMGFFTNEPEFTAFVNYNIQNNPNIKETATKIVIVMGSNDLFYQSNYNTVLSKINFIKQQFATTDISLAFVGTINKPLINVNRIITTETAYYRAASIAGIKILPNCQYNYLSSMADNVHPDDNGSTILAYDILLSLTDHMRPINVYIQNKITLGEGVSGSVTCTTHYFGTRNMTVFGNINVTFSASTRRIPLFYPDPLPQYEYLPGFTNNGLNIGYEQGYVYFSGDGNTTSLNSPYYIIRV